jgi:hypothetical protein
MRRDPQMTRVGITGHCELSTPTLALVETALRRVLLGHARIGRLTGVTCLAAGADQLFAQLVLDLGGRLEVILPAADYRAAHIGAGQPPEFERLLAAARAVRVMAFDRSSRQAYMAASYAMLAGVDTVVAVWDGHPATRLGSTGDVVTAARGLGLPLSIIWPPGAARAPADQLRDRPPAIISA